MDELFEAHAQEQRVQAAAEDADPAVQRRMRAKREAALEREIRQGLRTPAGDWILDPEEVHSDD